MNVYQEIAGEQAALASLRRFFHQHPELSGKEFKTAEKIEAELNALSVSHRRVGETGVYGEIIGEKGAGPVVVLRADIDALPIEEENDVPYASQTAGVMHACGHDMHTACLLFASRALAKRRAEFGGTVRLFFQQAEEIGYGGKVFVNEGLMDGADRVFGIHSAPDLAAGTVGVKPGPNNASVDYFKIRVHGRAAHVSTPQLGADALYAASQIVTAVQGIVTRRTSPIDSVIIGIGKLTAGTAYNIVAGEAEMEGTTRLFTPSLRAFVRQQVDNTARLTAELNGATADVTWVDYASPLVNDPKVCREVGDTVRALFGAEALVTDRALSCGGDDFAEFLLKAPGAYAYVGTAGETPGSCGPAHNSHFDIDERALTVGAALYAQCALSWLQGQAF